MSFAFSTPTNIPVSVRAPARLVAPHRSKGGGARNRGDLLSTSSSVGMGDGPFGKGTLCVGTPEQATAFMDREQP